MTIEDELGPYRGMKDFLPPEQETRSQIFSTLRRVSHQHGFQEYATPIVEKYEIFQHKTSDEILQTQMFTFSDPAGRRLVLRPEMTPVLSRLIRQSGHLYEKPLRWFCLADCFRYERPQKGRQRAFLQFNADIIGDDGLQGDYEILMLAFDLIQSFGVAPSQFELHLNNRSIFSEWLTSHYQVSPDVNVHLFRILDKRHKISDEQLRQELSAFLSPDQVHDFLSFDFASLAQSPCYQPLRTFKQDLIHILGPAFADTIQINPFLSRGFDYYTGLVFEMFLKTGTKRAILGGGRYDRIMVENGENTLKAVGFGISDTMILEMSSQFIQKSASPSLVLLYDQDHDEQRLEMLKIARMTRSFINTVCRSNKNLKKTLRQLSKAPHVEWVLFKYHDVLTLKNLKNQYQFSLHSPESIKDYIYVS